MNITIEQAAQARAVAAGERLASLADVYMQREADNRNAVAEVTRIERAWGAGDSGPTASDYSLATIEVTRTAALVKRAGQELTALHNASPVLDFDLHAEVAARVSDLYGDVRTVLTDRLPTGDALPKVGNAPALYIAMQRAPHDEGGGILAADVQLALYGRSRIIQAPPAEDFATLFDAAGWVVDIHREQPRETSSGVWLSLVTLKVKRAWLPVPVIDTTSKATPRHIENRLDVGGLIVLVDLLRAELDDVARLAGGEPVGFTAYSSTSAVIVDGDGVTHETLSVPFRLALAQESWRVNTEEVVRIAGQRFVAKLVPGLGVVESVSVRQVERGHCLAFELVRREPVADDEADDGGEVDAA